MKRSRFAGSGRSRRILNMVNENETDGCNKKPIYATRGQGVLSSADNSKGTFSYLKQMSISVDGITEITEIDDDDTSNSKENVVVPSTSTNRSNVNQNEGSCKPKDILVSNTVLAQMRTSSFKDLQTVSPRSETENQLSNCLFPGQENYLMPMVLFHGNKSTDNVLVPTVSPQDKTLPTAENSNLLDISNNVSNLLEESDLLAITRQNSTENLLETNNSLAVTPSLRQRIDFIASPTVLYINKDYELQNISDLENVLHNIENTDGSPEIQISEQETTSSNVTPSRKRKRNEKSWRDSVNKALKNRGDNYESVRSKKMRSNKNIGPACSCKLQCYNNFDESARNNIFTKYWAIGDHERQWDFIIRYVKRDEIKKITINRKNNRTQTLIYHLPADTVDTSIKVCKTMFLNTLSITQQVVYTALEKNSNEQTVSDLRGQHTSRPKKMSDETESSIIMHINKFPRVEAHYVRKDSQKEYLDETLNISKMHRLYLTWIETEPQYSEIPKATKRQYQHIFNTKFNLSFHKPKKDQCEICSIYKFADEARKIQLKEEYEKHIKAKNLVRQLKEEEKLEFDKKDSVVACFDLEKVLILPQSEVGAFHYKRKYPVYNFTVFDLLESQGYCYAWHYQIAKRGAIEIASCLWLFIKDQVRLGKKTFSFYSDSCSGQNRNRFVFAMFVLAAKTFDIVITHRFFEKGHSQSEGDSMHATIERAKMRHTIYNPDQMYLLIENAKVSGNKYKLKAMLQTDFLDFKELIKGKNWLNDTNGVKIYWSKIKEVKFSFTNPGSLFFKYDLEDESQEMQSITRTNSRRRGRETSEYNADSLKPAYSGLIPIPAPLYKDLIHLCDSGAIPEHFQSFYRSLVPTNNITTLNNDSDEDEEV